MKIGALALAAHCTTETIRFYESAGLLPPPARTAGNYRQYDQQHLDRLRFIRNCRALDMTHAEIKTLLQLRDMPTSECGPVNALIDQHLAVIDRRIAELQHLRDEIRALRDCCVTVHEVSDCKILQGISEMPANTRPGQGRVGNTKRQKSPE